MTITSRVTWYFLIALAAILIGFSTAVYWLTHHNAYRELDERLDSALSTLAAAAEVKPDGIEWDLAERKLDLASDIYWDIYDPPGYRIAGRYLDSGDIVGHWEVRSRTLECTNYDPSQAGVKEKLYPSITLSAKASIRPIRTQLRVLALILIAVSLAIWLTAFFLGRFVCRWALKPITRMAIAAQSMQAGDLGERLPVPTSDDELRDLGLSFNALLQRVEEAYERQRQFTAEASHQLRTPLAGLLGQIEVALRRPRSTEEYSQTLGSIHRQGQRLHQIVESLLFLARADAEAALPQRESFAWGPWLIEHIERCWGEHPRRADIVIEAAEAGVVSGQPVLLGELVNVLIDNALRYRTPGSPVQVRVQKNELSVADAGIGISEADRARLFEPFYRSEEARLKRSDGLGLGLAIAKRIAIAHGGTLIVESAVGKGSTFTLRLPNA